MGLHKLTWFQISWISPFNASLNFLARALVIGPIGTWIGSATFHAFELSMSPSLIDSYCRQAFVLLRRNWYLNCRMHCFSSLDALRTRALLVWSGMPVRLGAWARASFSLACCLSPPPCPALILSLALAWIAILLEVVLFSIGASFIPFFEHNDSTRAFG